MHPYSNFAYAKLNIKFDADAFADEYDKYILPASQDIATRWHPWYNTRELNKSWGMVDPIVYDKCSVEMDSDQPGVFTLDPREIPQWKMLQLLSLHTVESDSDYVKQCAGFGGSTIRNHHLDRLWTLKPEFKHLEIVKFILRELPFSKISGIHCVSLAPGSFASIHRDARFVSDVGLPFDQNNGANNGVYRSGSIIINLNISDGGVPLWWSLDGADNKKVLKTNDQVYMISDYFLHGVPLCTSRRRQIRITGTPSAKLANFIDQSTKIELPTDYVFDNEPNWFPG